MLGIKPNLSDAATVARLASLPAFGQAAALIRRVDPLWGIFRDYPGEKPVWTVYISRGEGECPYCHCDCNDDLEESEIEVAALSEESARRKAERIMATNAKEYKGFTIDSIDPPAVVEVPVPDEIEEQFEAPEDREIRLAKEAAREAMRAASRMEARKGGDAKQAPSRSDDSLAPKGGAQ